MATHLLIRDNKQNFVKFKKVIVCDFFDHWFVLAGESLLIKSLDRGELPTLTFVEYNESLLRDIDHYHPLLDYYPHHVTDTQDFNVVLEACRNMYF